MRPSSIPSSKGQRVLIVDDDRALLLLLQRVLQNGGYEAATAENGQIGLQLFEQEPWDLIVLDRAMPEMGGEELAMRIRAVAPNLPILLITGFLQMVGHPELFNAILEKPFRPSELTACVSDTLRASR